MKTWSKTQPIVALSTGESELAAVVRASAEGLGTRSVLADFGYHVKVRVESDATVAIGIVRRQGLGRVRHLAVADLWVQQRAQNGEVEYLKVDGKQNPADLMTKGGLTKDDIHRHLAKLRVKLLSGRASCAPTAKTVLLVVLAPLLHASFEPFEATLLSHKLEL